MSDFDAQRDAAHEDALADGAELHGHSYDVVNDDALLALVNRDSMIGVSFTRRPERVAVVDG